MVAAPASPFCPSVSAAILCGGLGRRLGGVNKSNLPVAGRAILDRQLDALGLVGSALTAPPRLIGHCPSADARGLTVVADLVDAGALGGLYTALVSSPTDYVLVLAGDLPFVTPAFLTYLAGRAARDAGVSPDAVVPRDAAGSHPLCAVYHRRIAPVLERRITAGALRIVDALGDLDVDDIGPTALSPFDPDGHLLLNVNTPDDYRRATTGSLDRGAIA